MWTVTTSKTASTALMVSAMLTVGGSVYAQKSDRDGVVILITQTRSDQGEVTADDTPGFPVTISESGSYRLASNLIVPDQQTNAVDITVGNVLLDLNGFSILGAGGGSGIGINAPFPPGPVPFGPGNVKVLNGLVRGMGVGVNLGPSCRVEGMHVLQNGVGVSTAQGCTIVNNTVNINTIGIQAGPGATVIGNTVKNNGGLGMQLFSDAGYAHNVVTGNNGGNANAQVTGGIQMGGNVCGGGLCP